jgi:membrane protease YdiL (CAAX protease family)
MNRITNWIKRHQVAAFFILTFTISWGLGFSWSAVLKGEQYLVLPLAFVTACSPGLAGIIISGVINTQPRTGPRKAFWIALLVAWFISTLVFLANLKFIEQNPLSPVAVGLFTIAAVPVAFVIASAYSRNPSVRGYLASLVRLKGVLGWSLVALILFPALFLISVPVSSYLNQQPIPYDLFPELSLSLIGLVAVKFLYQFFFFNATGEETGWRGFAMPRLQTRTSPLIAALVIALFWVPWHFFGWQAEGKSVLTLEFWIDMGIGHILLSVLIVWICNRARGSILVAGIAHAAMNTVQAFAPFGDRLFLVLSVAALVMILVDQMWKKLPTDHPAVYREPGMTKVEVGRSEEILEVSNV